MNAAALKDKVNPSDIPPPLSKLANAAGLDALYTLCELYGGMRLNIPKPDALVNETRRRLLIADYETGKYTLETLAEKYDVSIRTAFNYTRKEKKEKPR